MEYHIPVKTRRWRNAGLMLGQRLRRRRWPNIKPALRQRLVFTGYLSLHPSGGVSLRPSTDGWHELRCDTLDVVN